MSKIKNDDESSLSHTKWNCQYHIVFIPKYRRKAIYGKLRSDIGKYIRRLCEYKGGGNRRSKCLSRPHTYACKNSTQNKYIIFHGIFKGEK